MSRVYEAHLASQPTVENVAWQVAALEQKIERRFDAVQVQLRMIEKALAGKQ